MAVSGWCPLDATSVPESIFCRDILLTVITLPHHQIALDVEQLRNLPSALGRRPDIQERNVGGVLGGSLCED